MMDKQLHDRSSSGLDVDEVVNLNYGFGNFEVPQIPGNSELDYQEVLKLGARHNRYGIFGDNGYTDLIEINKRAPAIMEKTSSTDNISLSKDNLNAVFKQISDYHQQKIDLIL